jgi:hypothetical protein
LRLAAAPAPGQADQVAAGNRRLTNTGLRLRRSGMGTVAQLVFKTGAVV